MKQPDKLILLLFKSVHETMKMERFLEDAGIAHRTVSKPRTAGKDCGLAIRIDISDLQRADDIARKNECAISSVLEKHQGVWTRRKDKSSY